MSKLWRLIGLVAAAAALAFTSTSWAQSRAVIEFDLPAQALEASLRQVADGQKLQIIYVRSDLAGIQARPMKARLTVQEAIERLIEGTGLVASFNGGDTVVIRPKAEERKTNPRIPMTSVPPESSAAPVVEKIVVSAQKRGLEYLQDVPVPITVLRADVLVERNQLSLRDYFNRIPGLNYQAGNSNGDSYLSIRGINGALNPTVGIMVDDVPFGSSLFRSGGRFIPDLDPGDLARIEVLRGPQGTLYGVSSLGGLIRYVTLDPSTDRVSGNIQAGISKVSGGHELGNNLRGAINVPLSDTLAVRASAFTRLDPGYIDNPANNAKDVNRRDATGGLFSAMWRPSDAFTLKLSAFYQQLDMDGSDRIDPSLGDLQQTYLAGTGWSKSTREGYSATLSAKLGSVDVTSLTGYNANRYRDAIDLANAGLNAISNTVFGVSGFQYVEDYNATKFSQEIRLSMPIGERFDVLIGGFYTQEKYKFPTTEYASNPVTGDRAGLLALFDARGTYNEYAGFADLTVHFTDRFDVQVGGRKSRNTQDYSEIDTGAVQLVRNGLLVIPNSSITESPFTYLVTPQYRVSPDLMVYGRSASGYRAGGVNPAFARGYPVPPGWKSDKTYAYEIGAKGSLFDRALAFDASLFYVDWKDLQINFTYIPGVGYTANGSRARSQGIELSLEAHPLRGMTVAGSMSYDDARLSENFGASITHGDVGDRLPFTSKLAGNLSVDQRFPLAGSWIGLVGVSLAYVGDRLGILTGNTVRQNYPAYSQVDARAGVEFGAWRLNAFVTNIGDRRGLIGGGIGQSNPKLFQVIQPRTMGISVSKRF